MKASELVVQLQALIAQHGDKTVLGRCTLSTGPVYSTRVGEAPKDADYIFVEVD